jgi:VIT1/CCC1 family predicted Fe2+/Mn2+ transporter
MPMLPVLVSPRGMLIPGVVVTSILFLALLGVFGAHAGGAPLLRSTLRVTFWGALAMALTAGVGAMFGAAI